MTGVWRAENGKYLLIDEQRSRRRARLVLWRSPWLTEQVGENSDVNGHAEQTVEKGVKSEKNRFFGLIWAFLPFWRFLVMTSA